MMVRIMMVRLIARATRHHELRATCFPRGGVPTYPSLSKQILVIIRLDCMWLSFFYRLSILIHYHILKGAVVFDWDAIHSLLQETCYWDL